jgi:DNA gyrase inhibitor GyrI
LSDVVERADTPIEFIACADEVAAIQAAWAELESIVPVRGNRFFGVVDGERYRVCVEARDASYGLEAGTVPGGPYARERLRGTPPAVYARIGPAVQELERVVDVDVTRPVIEHYRRVDEIDVLVPVR